MATVTGDISLERPQADLLTGTPRAHALDRWIFVFMAAWFIAIVLVGFIPDSMMKVAMVKAGARAPFPAVLHMHAVLMGAFLLLLLAQTVMVKLQSVRPITEREQFTSNSRMPTRSDCGN